ncbi:flagellar biosynthetic protein FliO [Alteribacter populi]|uniref:flagellar biosynthetic protein FliO n=1 Tax=Alteribacter populi TaxID=2011011 RepID=UPI001E3D3034|nr:flagellar biosynthetic protein FliO [Alteribacter populi]
MIDMVSKKQRVLFLISIVSAVLLYPENMKAENDDFGEGSRSVIEGLQKDTEEDPAVGEELSPSTGNNEVGSNESELPVQNDQNYFWMIVQMFLALAFVIALIYGILKLVNKRSQSMRNHSTIRSIGGVNLGPNRSVQLVKVGNRLLVVGVGETIQLLKEVTDPAEIEQMLEEHRPQESFEAPINKAGEWIKRSLQLKSNSQDSSFSALLDERMKGVKASHDKVHSAVKEKE